MKNISILFILLHICFRVFSQIDDYGNPVFHSIIMEEKEFKDCVVISSYYKLADNIDNKLSSVYISETPSLDEIEKATTELNSHFFLLTKERRMIGMVLLNEHPNREFIFL